MTDLPTLIGALGVGLLLVAFFLNLFQRTTPESLWYVSMNLVGAGLSCYASWLIGFVPFVVLEGTWAVVAGVALVRLLRKRGAAEG